MNLLIKSTLTNEIVQTIKCKSKADAQRWMNIINGLKSPFRYAEIG